VRAPAAARPVSPTQPLEQFSDLIARARKRGASAAEAMLVEGGAMSVSQRLGQREDLLRSEGREAGLRVFFGKRQAMASTSDLSPAALNDLLERVLVMADGARRAVLRPRRSRPSGARAARPRPVRSARSDG
jgi:PmbA protein